MNHGNESFYLKDNEIYDRLCGEILVTTFGRIAIQCTLCDFKYSGFDGYISHLYSQHLTIYTIDSIADEEQEQKMEPITKIEIDTFNVEGTLKEEECSIASVESSSVQKSQDNKIIGKQKSATEKKRKQKQIAKEDILDELKIPEDIREVKKRTIYGLLAEERNHKCPICGLAFKERQHLRHHFRRHSEEAKNHQCPQCDKKFYTRSELRTHMQFHAKERRFVCNDCGSAFLTKSHFVSHAKRHTNQRDFKCSICDKAFNNRGQLKSHMPEHSSELLFTCDFCPAAFLLKETHKNHMKLHDNKLDYKGKLRDEFNQKAGQFSHMRIHKIK